MTRFKKSVFINAIIYFLIIAASVLFFKAGETNQLPIILQGSSPYIWVGEYQIHGFSGFIDACARTYSFSGKLFDLWMDQKKGMSVQICNASPQQDSEIVGVKSDSFSLVSSTSASDPSLFMKDSRLTLLYVDNTGYGRGIFKKDIDFQEKLGGTGEVLIDHQMIGGRDLKYFKSPVVFQYSDGEYGLAVLAQEKENSDLFLLETKYPLKSDSAFALIKLNIPQGMTVLNFGAFNNFKVPDLKDNLLIINAKSNETRLEPGRRPVEGYGLLRKGFGDWSVEWDSPVVEGERLYKRLDSGGVYFTGNTEGDIFYSTYPEQDQLNARFTSETAGIVKKKISISNLKRLYSDLSKKEKLETTFKYVN